MKNSKQILEILKENNAPEEIISTLETEIKDAEKNNREWKMLWILIAIVFLIGILARL